MKTDRFTDIIRRKLESIRPEFTDKDWARMQSTLRDANLSQPNTPNSGNPFSGGVWSSGKSWLLAAASVSAVVLMTYGFWQQREINQLRQTIGQLRKHPANQSAPALSSPGSGEQTRPDVAHSDNTTSSQHLQESTTSANRNESQAVRPDTVYITRYVPVPSREKPAIRNKERISQHPETSSEQQYVTENPKLAPTSTNQPTHLSTNQQPESHDAFSTPSSVAKNATNESTGITKSPNTSAKDQSLTGRSVREHSERLKNTLPLNSTDKQSSVAVNTKATTDNQLVQTEPSTATSEISATYEPVASLPLSVESKNWGAALTQRARKMRPAQPKVIPVESAQPQAPASQPVPRLATRFRAGVGGEVASRLWSAGVFAEVLLGTHWTVGVGLSQATYLSKFITEDDFNDRTHRDFRKEFARPGDLWRDILNIDTRQTRLQVPVSLGYRIPLNQSLTLLPAVGTYLNLSNSENVTYYCRDSQRPPFPYQPQSGFDEISTSKSQPVDLVNSFAFGAGIEWQRGHWAVQGTPVITIPTQTNQPMKQTDLNWQTNTTIGLRARLLYQF